MTPAPARPPGALGVDEKRETFRRLHETGCFVIPNPWDIGSARYLASLGFQAVATTSSGFAWSRGRTDNGITVDEVLHHLADLAAGVDLPVNADFEGGFAVEPAGVAANVRRAVATGIAGRPHLAETVRRLSAYAEAGADCLYAPGLRTREEITAVVRAVAPKPVNVLVGSDFTTVAELASLGVRRISVGGALARAAWGGFARAAGELARAGTFGGFSIAMSSAELEILFKRG